jgi:chromosome segregation ATPase
LSNLKSIQNLPSEASILLSAYDESSSSASNPSTSINLLKQEVSRLKKLQEELEIVVMEQNEKLEQYEKNGISSNPIFDENHPRIRDLIALVSHQRQSLEENESLVGRMKDEILELRAKSNILEQNSATSRPPSISMDSVASRLREAESTAERERRARLEEEKKSGAKIASLETELSVIKGK